MCLNIWKGLQGYKYNLFQEQKKSLAKVSLTREIWIVGEGIYMKWYLKLTY